MSENDNKNIEKLDENLDLTTENEEDNSENNPDIDPELTKIDQSLLDENGDYDKIQPINLSNEMQNSFLSYAMSVIVSCGGQGIAEPGWSREGKALPHIDGGAAAQGSGHSSDQACHKHPLDQSGAEEGLFGVLRIQVDGVKIAGQPGK